MADQIVVTEVIIDSRGAKEGSAEYVTAMNAIARVQQNMQGTFDRTIEKMRALAEAGSNGAMVMTNGAQSISRTAREYDKLLASINPTTAALKKAEEQYQRTMNVVSQNLQLGRPIEEANKVIADATRNLKLMQDTAKGIEIQGPMRQTAAEIKQVAEAASKAEHELRAAASAAEALASRGSRYKANVDPQFAAQERYNASVAEAKSLLEQGAIGANHYAAGIAKADAELKQATADNSGLTASLKQAAAAFKEVEKASRDAAAAAKVDAAKKLAEATKQAAEEQIKFQRALDETNPEQANDRRRNERMKEYTAYLKEGKFTQEEFNNAQAFANRQHELTRRSIEGTNVAMGKYAKGTGLARHELVNLSRQGQDVFVSLASGQSPLTVLIQQGTQIADVFATSKGSISGFFVQLAQAALPLAPIILGVSAALGALAAAWSVMGQRQDLSNSLMGIGRAAGLTGDELNKLAKESAEAGQVSIATSREIAAEYVKTGKIAAPVIRDLIKVTRDYAATTQQDIPAAAKELAAAFADPIKGIETINAKLGSLGPAYQKMIRDAVAQNDTLRAQKILMDNLATSTTNAAETQGLLTRAWERWKLALSNTANMAGEAITNAIDPAKQAQVNTILDRRAAIQKQIGDLQKADRNNTGRIARLQSEDADLARREESLKSQLATEQKITQEQADRVRNTTAANRGAAVSRSYEKDADAIDRLKAEVGALDAALKVADKSYQDLIDKRTPGDDPGFMKAQAERDKLEANLEIAKRAQREYNDAVSVGGLEADKAAEATRIQAKYIGEMTPKLEAQRAAELKLNDLRGTTLSDSQREAAARNEATNALLAGTRAAAEAENAARYGIKTDEAATKAIRDKGSAYGEAAQISEEAKRKATATGANPEKVEADDTAAALAKVQRERAMNNAQMIEAAAIQKRYMDQVNAGRISLAEAEKAIRRDTETSAERNRLRALGVTDEKALAAAYKDTAAAVNTALSAEQARSAASITQNQTQTIEALQREIDLIGKSVHERRIELEIMQAKQQLQQAGIPIESNEAKAILKRAENIGVLNNRLSDQARLQQQLRQSMDFAADGLKSFVEELLTGTDGINGALKSLGKGFLSASLDALISGKGPLAGITGLASSDPNKQGGLMGLFSGGNIQALSKQLGKEVKDGAKAGVGAGVESVAGDTSAFKIFGIDGKDLAGGLTAIAGLAGAYGSGAAAGSYGQAVGGGALSGGMAGLALAGTGIGASLGGAGVLGPIGMILGGALAYFGQKSAREAAKKQREEEAQANYKAAEPQIATMRSQLRGEAQDTLRNRLRETESNVMKLIDVAFYASKIDEANALGTDYWNYRYKQIEDFQRAVPGLIDSMMQGLGPNSAFASARDSVKSTGDALKGFVADVEFALGPDSPYLQQAKAAALEHALSILDGAKTLSTVATRMEEIRGAGAALNQLLVELGMSATDAAAAIERDTIAAINRLRTAFESDINSQINEAQGYGYVNEFNALFAEYAKNMKDAEVLASGVNLAEWFRSQAQEIVDGAQVAGSAFDTLIAGFPQLAGVVTEFTDGLKGAAKEADIAARKMAYLDRLFAATNPTDTLEGQLAAYSRQAQRERQEEIRKGGQALIELDAAQAAERYNIIKAWNDKIADAQKAAADEATSFWDRFSKSIKQYTDGLRAGADSPLSPQARLAAAQSQYNAQLALARTGDRDALSGITGYHKDFMDALRDFWGSSTTFQDLWASSIADLEALPEQVKPEDLIIDAIEAGAQQTVDAIAMMQQVLKASVDSGSAQQTAIALQGYFTKLDTNTDAALSYAEFTSGLGVLATKAEQEAARSIFNNIDADGNGMISKQEATNAALVGTGSVKSAIDATATQLLALAQISDKTGNVSTYASQIAWSASSIASSSSGSYSYLSTYLANLHSIANYTSRANSNLAVANANRVIPSPGAFSGLPGYADGGLITGPGTSRSDSIPIMASNREFMMNASATRSIGVGALNYMNENGRIPAISMGGAGHDNRAVVAELRAAREDARQARAETAALLGRVISATAQGALHVREGIDDVAETSAEEARAARRQRAAA